jgi:NifU-like protein involved in Fe-S cluster formation
VRRPLTLHVKIDGDRLAGVSFEGSGCAISKRPRHS